MTPEQAEDLAARTLAAIGTGRSQTRVADRERVASDLAGLRHHRPSPHGCYFTEGAPCADARRYADGLRRTAALYGVTP